MRKIIIVLILQIIFSSLCAENFAGKEDNSFPDEQETLKKRTMAYSAIFSPGLFTTLGFGMAELSADKTFERKFILRAGVGPLLLGGGVYLQHVFFKDSTRTGMFYTFDLGADVIYAILPDSGGGTGGVDFIIPNIAGGIGYSKKIGKNSYFRISLDLGLKAVFSNLNVSVTY
ncbi:MAG: hypothetical protein R6U84_05250 [Candidatus Cloacimonadales bacterium]